MRLFLHGRADYTFDVIGMAQHLHELDEILGDAPEAEQQRECEAALVLCSAKAYEKHKVAVRIDGNMVGYCPGHLSTQYREWLHEWRFSGMPVRCNAILLIDHDPPSSRPRVRRIRLDIEIPFKVTTG